MHESYPAAAGTLAGSLVDEAVPGLPAPLERGIEIGDPIAYMMDARAALLEKPGNRAIGVPRGQQLDLGFAEWEGKNVGAIGHFGGMRVDAKHFPIECGRGVEVGDRNSDMRDARGFGQSSLLNHGPDGSGTFDQCAASGPQ